MTLANRTICFRKRTGKIVKDRIKQPLEGARELEKRESIPFEDSP